MITIRLQSLKPEPRDGTVPMAIHTPGLIAWAKRGFGASRGQDRNLVTTIAESFNLKREVALALLSGEVDYTVDGDDVVIQWPGG